MNEEFAERFVKLYLRYRAVLRRGVRAGYLGFTPQQVWDEAAAMALWHMRSN